MWKKRSLKTIFEDNMEENSLNETNQLRFSVVCTLKEYRGSRCDGRVFLIRVQTMLNHFRFVFYHNTDVKIKQFFL